MYSKINITSHIKVITKTYNNLTKDIHAKKQFSVENIYI